MLGLSFRGWVWLGIVLATVALWWGAHALVTGYLEQRDAIAREEGRAEIRAAWELQVAAAQEIEERKEAARRVAQETADAEHSQALAAARSDAARAAGAAERLRAQLAAFVAAAGRQTGQGAAAPSAGPGVQGSDPLDLLANLFSRADREAGELAEYADTLRATGQRCERAYDAIEVTQ